MAVVGFSDAPMQAPGGVSVVEQRTVERTPYDQGLLTIWQEFVTKSQVERSKVGSEQYRSAEFAFLEKFTLEQNHRRRKPLMAEGIDRYEDWVPFRENKIQLTDGTEMGASSILSYIASEAPTEKNVQNFWQMIVEKGVEQIVMVTELSEKYGTDEDYELCYAYWPETSRSFENGLQVTFCEERRLLPEKHEHILIRKYLVSHEGKSREVVHYWYRNWADDTAPQEETIGALITAVKTEKKNPDVPVLVHCAAGVGRTGTFIALYQLLAEEESGEKSLSLFDFTGYLRASRPEMIGTLKQYEFCYKVLSGSTSVL